MHVLSTVKIIGIGIASLVGMLAIFVGGSAVALRGSVPALDGDVAVQGVSATVRIVRDADGLPHIYAQSRDDALFGLGYVHGQDRLWQMEFQRRTVQGRLAEIAGAPAVLPDTYLRTLGLYRAAQAATAHVSADTAAALSAYAAGVNAARPIKGRLPPEFFMLGLDPEPWQPADSVAVLKAISVQLSANAFQEIFRLQLLKSLGEEKARAFNPPLPAEVIEAYRRYAPREATKFADAVRALDAIAPMIETKGASNNWVVGGARTASGKPLLANDPHLPLTVPAFWYLAHLSWPGVEAIGGTVPGVPAIVAGRSNTVAWGMTTTGADTQDLYWEKLDPDDPRQYLTAEGSEPFGERLEVIKVRFGADKTIRVRSTRHGPVLPTDEPRLRALVPGGYALALRWPALDGEDGTIETALGMFQAPDAARATVERLFEPYRAPIQSFVYADVAGNIGLSLPGVIPVRRADNPVRGLLPADGRDPRFEWSGVLNGAEKPLWSGGAQDVFVTANNNVVPPGYKPMIALDFDPEHRARRIRTLIDEHAGPHTVDSFRAIQLDDGERFAMDVLPLLLAQTKGSDARAVNALARLKAWDMHMRPDAAEPLIFAAWIKAFTKMLTADELGELFERLWVDRPNFMAAVLYGEPGAAAFCDDVSTKQSVEDCGTILSRSLDAALDEVTSLYGADNGKWRWGEAHAASFSHTPFGFVPGLRDLFGLREVMGGGNSTIQRAAYRYSNREPFGAVHGSGYRAVYDLGNPNASIFMISTGQSGNVYSPYYGNLAPRWAKGEYLQMTTDEADINRRAVATLTLQPSSSDSAR
ncbi:MAG: penicillin acylase family protein [Alphaproteobacteria bacterium]|nr:penicillin acylase family protein [Alphaproteobacteria bacterium]